MKAIRCEICRQKLKYVVVSDGEYVLPVMPKSYKDAVAEARWRVKMFRDRNVEVHRVLSSEVVWKGGAK